MSVIIDRIRIAILNKPILTKLEKDLSELIRIDNLSDVQRIALIQRLRKITLLSNGKVNPKTAKTLAGFEFENYILHLTPSNLSGANLCPAASQGCRAACLNSAGRGRFDSVQYARLRKTLYYVNFKTEFLNHLDAEIRKARQSGIKNGIKVAMRLNGTSDIPFETIPVRNGLSLMELYPDVVFYDYTKIVSRLERLKLKNYSLTFSASESNANNVNKALSLGFNIAVVFDSIPERYQGRKVLNGDIHDFRFLDQTHPKGFLVGLKAKGPAKKDLSGFVIRLGSAL